MFLILAQYHLQLVQMSMYMNAAWKENSTVVVVEYEETLPKTETYYNFHSLNPWKIHGICVESRSKLFDFFHFRPPAEPPKT